MSAKKKTLAQRIRKLETRAGFSKDEIVKGIVLGAINEPNFKKQPKQAVEKAARAWLEMKIDELEEDVKRARKDAVREVTRRAKMK